MANDNLKRMLGMVNSMEKQSEKKDSKKSKIPTRVPRKQFYTQADRENQVRQLDEAVFGGYIPTQQEQEEWSNEKEYERLTEMADTESFIAKAKASNLPTAIIESMIGNPCNFTTDMLDENKSAIDMFAEKIGQKFGGEKKGKKEPVSGLEAARKITESVEKKDEVDKPQTGGVNIDMDALREMIGSLIDEKLSKLGTNSIKAMQLRDNGSFLFLDTNDNVFECILQYKGKRKKK